MVELQDSVDHIHIAEKLDMEVIDPKMNEAKSKKSKATKDGGGAIPDEESLFNRNLHETGV